MTQYAYTRHRTTYTFPFGVKHILLHWNLILSSKIKQQQYTQIEHKHTEIVCIRLNQCWARFWMCFHSTSDSTTIELFINARERLLQVNWTSNKHTDDQHKLNAIQCQIYHNMHKKPIDYYEIENHVEKKLIRRHKSTKKKKTSR